MAARSRVNQAPSGTFVNAELRNRPSRVINGSQTISTRSQLSFHTTMAINDTIVVVMNVTSITQVPYALPNLVVYVLSDSNKNGETDKP